MPHPRIHAASFADKPAAIMADTGETLTYGELEKRSNQAAHLFRRLGLKAGDTVAFWLPNRPEVFEVYWAGQRAGLYITPLSTALTEEEAAYILENSGAKVLVGAAAVKAFPALVAGPRPAGLETIYTIGERISGLEDWHEAIASEPTTPIADESAGFHMVYSSGTTGRPKGVMHTFGSFAPRSGRTRRDPIWRNARHRLFVAGPALSHGAAGLLHLLSPAGRKRGDPAEVRSGSCFEGHRDLQG